METQEPKRTFKSHRGVNFSAFEDEMLCKAWLETERDPRDPVVLSSQDKPAAYWDRVLETFNQLVESGPKRTTSSLMCRWSSIQQCVGRFCGFLTQSEITEQNDLSELDRINEAKRVYQVVQGQPFKFETCWNILKGTTKWEELCSTKTNTKKMRPTMDVDISTTRLGASCTPTTPSSTPSTPSTIPFESDIDPISLDDNPCKERSIRRKVEKESRSEGCSYHMTKLDEANMVLKTFLSDFIACLQKSEEIALRKLKLKEQKMLEQKIEKEEKIMDMDLSGMPSIQHDYYLSRQREILARWTASGQVGGSNEGHCGLQSEGNSGGQSGEGTV